MNKLLIKRSIWIFILMLVPSIANASDWVWRDGYWWKNNQPYYAVKSYGKWYYYPLPTYKDANWRDKLTEVIAQKEKYEAAAKASELEHAEWLEAVSALGYSTSTYGRSKEAIVQGSSLYGYQETINLYNPTNLDVQWNQADRHVDKALSIGGEALNGFRETLREAAEHEASAKERVAAIYAKAALLKAADTPEVKIKRTEITNQRTVDSKPVDSNGVLIVIEMQCASCHNAAEPKGGIDMTKYLAFDDEKRAKVKAAITNPDPEHRMPLKKEGDGYVPGKPLAFEELMAFQ